MVATTVAFGMTFFRFFDIPVFWPVLVVYFCVLFFLTMKRQIMVRCLPREGRGLHYMTPLRYITSLHAQPTIPHVACLLLLMCSLSTND